jgi:hypothetical protein
VRFVDSFPMTVTGKAQKYLMRKAMMKELALAEERTASAAGAGFRFSTRVNTV